LGPKSRRSDPPLGRYSSTSLPAGSPGLRPRRGRPSASGRCIRRSADAAIGSASSPESAGSLPGSSSGPAGRGVRAAPGLS
jgi:hypothetical protein